VKDQIQEARNLLIEKAKYHKARAIKHIEDSTREWSALHHELKLYESYLKAVDLLADFKMESGKDPLSDWRLQGMYEVAVMLEQLSLDAISSKDAARYTRLYTKARREGQTAEQARDEVRP
jgi:hypothetical protein